MIKSAIGRENVKVSFISLSTEECSELLELIKG